MVKDNSELSTKGPTIKQSMQKGGVGLVSALRLGHQWWSRIVMWCEIGQCAAARTSVVV